MVDGYHCIINKTKVPGVTSYVTATEIASLVKDANQNEFEVFQTVTALYPYLVTNQRLLYQGIVNVIATA